MSNKNLSKFFIAIGFIEKSISLFLVNETEIIETNKFISNSFDKFFFKNLKSLLHENNLKISNITKIFITKDSGTWNANRLITFFAKISHLIKNIEIFEINNDFFFLKQKKKINILKFACKVENPKNLSPNYNTWQITNT